MTPAAALARAAWTLRQPPPEVPAGQLAVPTGPRIGSLCTGYGGLDTAIQQVLGGTLAWVSDPDPGAAAILTHHHPDVPNLGDLTAVEWAAVEPVDIVCGGYPCQPFSIAGQLKGIEDERHIWPDIARALGVLRPRIAIFENVANHLRLGFDTVLADLAGLGFDAEWRLVRASDVGAPHQRRRLFIVAAAQDTDGAARDQRGLAAPRQAEAGRARADLGGRGGASAPDGQGAGLEGPGLPGRPAVSGRAPADADRDAVRQQPVGQPGGGSTAVAELARSDAAADWGRFAAVIARWEHVTGRRAPRATDARNRLSPLFVEWLMGLPEGHVTAVPGLTRTQQLKALGNGVVPQQAAAALRALLTRIEGITP